MNRIDAAFNKLKTSGKKGLIPFITAGDPNLEITRQAVLEMASAGADIIELGIPFSDPLADGPTIQKSSLRSLAGKTSLKKVFETVRVLREKTDVPICFMSYYNPIFALGEQQFFCSARECGVDGVIVPDLPPEEAETLINSGLEYNVKTIFLAAPTSPPERIELISQVSTGFVYYVSLTGITGTRNRLSCDLRQNLEKIRLVTPKPLAVGFGISNAGMAKEVSRWADAVIIGSALVKIFEEHQHDPALLLTKLKEFIMEVRNALDE